MRSAAQSRLIAAVEEASKHIDDATCDDEARRFLTLPGRVRFNPPKRAELEAGRQEREIPPGKTLRET